MSKEYPWGKGTPKWVRDATLNDSDKSFTVPAGKAWDVKLIEASLTATATVGNRQLIALITNGTNVVWASTWAGNITASQVGMLSLHNAQTTGTVATTVALDGATAPTAARQDSIPPMILPAGYVVRVFDRGVIDAAADDLIVVLHYVEYDA